MAKYKAWYASEDEIPQFARDNSLYVNRNGRWEFDYAEFESLEELTSPGLATNKATILTEKKETEVALKSEKKRADDAEAELRKSQKPGTKIIDSNEAKMLEDYQKLGAPKDLEKIKTEHQEMAGKLGSLEGEKELRKLCEDAKINFDAVNDFMQTKANGAKLTVKDVTEKDEKDKEVLVKRAFITIEKPQGDGKFKLEESSLKEYAEKNVPAYMTTAMFAVDEISADEKKVLSTGVKLPTLSGGKAKTGAGGEERSRAEDFNAQRNGRALPWETKEQAVT